MTTEYDVIIIGSGPNGLTTGAYLSKAGQKVLLLEKRFEVGGGLATEQVTLPDFFHNTHAVYKMMVDYAPVYADFEFEEKYNVKHIFPELQVVLPLSDGRCLCMYQDVDKTCESIARFSKKDADAYRSMHSKYDELMREILGPQTYVPPESALIMAAKMEETQLGRELAELSGKTPKEIVCDLYENDHVRTLMLYMACHWGLDYDQAGVGYMVPIYLNRMVNYRLTAGGSHRASNAFVKTVFENKGRVRTSAQIKRIIIENNEAKGVELEDGTTYTAKKAVVSTIDPHQTFLKYVGEDNLETDFIDMIKNYHWEKWSLCNIHLAMAEPPVFKAAESDPDINQALIYLLGYESLEDLLGHLDAIGEGELPETAGFNCSFPSVHDPYQAPEGKASGLISQMAPFDLNNGGSERWLNYKFREETTEKLISMLAGYTLNITQDKVKWTAITTPADIQNKFANMVKGGYKQGAYHPLQMGYLRPNQDCSQNRTPIKGLYVGGASVYPGGMVLFGPGYNCANRIAEDFEIDKWWKEPDMVTRAREKGYV